MAIRAHIVGSQGSLHDVVSVVAGFPRHTLTKNEIAAAGICVRARDTGRILMLQRSISDLDDPNAGKWEFPGGRLEPGEAPAQAAVREWQEETGLTLPSGTPAGSWSCGCYEGYLYLVPREADVELNLAHDDRHVANPDDPDGDDVEVIAWWPPTEARANPGLRPELADADWQLIQTSLPDPLFKTDTGRVTLSIRRRRYPTLVTKDQPPAAETHVDGPDWTPETKRKKKRKADDALPISVVKTDQEHRVVYGVVLEPDVEDSQGDVISKDDIELAAHRFLYRGALLGDQHRKLAPGSVKPVESFIAPCDFELGGQTVRKGSWVLAAHVPDDELWAQVKTGQKAAWSVAGSGRRTPLG